VCSVQRVIYRGAFLLGFVVLELVTTTVYYYKNYGAGCCVSLLHVLINSYCQLCDIRLNDCMLSILIRDEIINVVDVTQ
jgi:hypothetical protein